MGRACPRSMLRVVGTLLGSVVLFGAATAFANPGGVAGYTGKPTTTAPQGQSCNACHTGGAAPQVSITGPASLKAGESAEYAVVVATGAARASGAVAATSGVMLAPIQGGGLRDSFGELVQDGSRSPSGGQAQFRFRLTAPLSGTSVRLWAVGMGSNGSGTGGDGSAQITKDIAVTGGSSTGNADAGSSASKGGSSGSSGSSGDDDAEDSDDDSPSGSAAKRRMSTTPPASACALGSGSHLGGSSGLALGMLAMLAMLGLVVARRATRRSCALTERPRPREGA